MKTYPTGKNNPMPSCRIPPRHASQRARQADAFNLPPLASFMPSHLPPAACILPLTFHASQHAPTSPESLHFSPHHLPRLTSSTPLPHLPPACIPLQSPLPPPSMPFLPSPATPAQHDWSCQ